MTERYRIAPSLLSADFGRLRDEVQAIEAAGADLLHLDVMDNHYVPNLTIGPMVCGAIRPHTRLPIDVHLMVEPVDASGRRLRRCRRRHHQVPSRGHRSSTGRCRSSATRLPRGLVLNPATPLTWLDHTLDSIDLLLLMCVNPGFGGQQFIDYVLHKIARRASVSMPCAAAGARSGSRSTVGSRSTTSRAVAAAGGDTFVAGSAVFGAPDPDGGYRRRAPAASRGACAARPRGCPRASYRAMSRQGRPRDARPVDRAVCIDLDGTLLDTVPDLAAAANAMLVELGSRRCRRSRSGSSSARDPMC